MRRRKGERHDRADWKGNAESEPLRRRGFVLRRQGGGRAVRDCEKLRAGRIPEGDRRARKLAGALSSFSAS